MTTINAQVPDSLFRQVQALINREQISLDQLVAMALNAQIALLATDEYLERRAKRANLSRVDELLSKVSTEAKPLPGDELL